MAKTERENSHSGLGWSCFILRSSLIVFVSVGGLVHCEDGDFGVDVGSDTIMSRPVATTNADVYYMTYNDHHYISAGFQVNACKSVRKLAQTVFCSGELLWTLGRKRVTVEEDHRIGNLGFLARKFHAVLHFLRTRKTHHSIMHNPVVCFLDGFDVINIRPLHDFKDNFDRMWRNLQLPDESGASAPPMAIFNRERPGDGKVNTGVYCGYAEDIERLLSMIEEYFFESNASQKLTDQMMMNSRYFDDPVRYRVAIDTNGTLFEKGLRVKMPYDPPICPVRALEKRGENQEEYPQHMETGARPYFVHYAGRMHKHAGRLCEIQSCSNRAYWVYDTDHKEMVQC